MKKKTFRLILALVLLLLIIVLSYEENQKFSNENLEDYDTSLGSLLPFREKETITEETGTFEEEIPEHIKNSPCGSFFKQTGICAGICPNGKCISDEKGCYCRL